VSGVRTVVVSDLHLGSRSEADVLRRRAPRDKLIERVEGADRLVLLGDTIELRQGPAREAMAVAQPVLEELGGALGKGGEVILVPGNHDHALVRPWLRARRRSGKRLGLAAAVPVSASPALERVAAWLRPAKVRVQYPGTWLAPRIWATHGHYLDRHLVPQETWGARGLPRRLLGEVPAGRARAEDYERASGPSVAPSECSLAAALPRVLGEPLDRAAGLARRASSAIVPLAASIPGAASLAPITSNALGQQFRRAGLPAMAEVAARLGVRADHVVFGHLHRLGARDGDDPDDWAPGGHLRLHNSGSWVYEPLLLTGAEPPHQYWPGGALLLDGDGPPRAVALLDELDRGALRAEAAGDLPRAPRQVERERLFRRLTALLRARS